MSKPPLTYPSLSIARSRRDKLAQWLADDAATYMSPEKAQELADEACQAIGDWAARLAAHPQNCFRRWDGEGVPDWSYVHELIETIKWIAAEERRQVQEAINSNTTT